jgi:hypothetical protein
MNYAESLKEMFKDGCESLWRTVKPIPEDKLDWKAAPEVRTVRELLGELVNTTKYTADLMNTLKEPGMDNWNGDQTRTPEQFEKEFRSAMEEYFKALDSFPEDKLAEKITLPWGELTFHQVIAYAYWNLMYHLGQINYIQTLYGDKNFY